MYFIDRELLNSCHQKITWKYGRRVKERPEKGWRDCVKGGYGG